jgi:hypothetical protein
MHLDGTGNKLPIQSGDSVNVSFWAKRNSSGFTNRVNIYLKHNSAHGGRWTAIVGRRYKEAVTPGAEEYFTPKTGEWTKFSYTAKAPYEDEDLDNADENSDSQVDQYETCSFQITSSIFEPDIPPISEIIKEVYFDDFQITSNKPQVHISHDGALIYQTGENYIQMNADGLYVKGGDINTNSVTAMSVAVTEAKIGELLGETTSSDLFIGNDEQVATVNPGNVIIRAAPTQDEGSGETGGSIVLFPASGSAAEASKGYVSVSGSLNIEAALSKGSGTFKIKHPNPVSASKYYLQHSFIESPTRGDNLYRWSKNLFSGSNSLDLPDYYRFLNENSMVWVNPIEHFGRGYGKVNENQTQIDIEVENDGEYNILCIGTRKDKVAVDNFEGVIIDRENN